MSKASLVDEPSESVEGRQVAAVVADEERGGCRSGDLLDGGALVDVERGPELERLAARFEPEAESRGEAASEVGGLRLEVRPPAPMEPDCHVALPFHEQIGQLGFGLVGGPTHGI